MQSITKALRFRGLIVAVCIGICATLPAPAQEQDQQSVFATYAGGSQNDQVRGVAIDATGAVIIVGGTPSTDYPVQTNGSGFVFDSSPNGSWDAFVTKYSSSGTMLWSTMLGGPNYDRAYSVAVDGQNNIYVAGRAGAGFPVTAGAAQTTFRGGQANSGDSYGEQDGFVCKFSSAGVRLFCSYFGESAGWIVRDVAVDGVGRIYLAAGYKAGSYPPAVASAFLNTPRGGTDAVLASFTTDGSQVRWARYVGGSAADSHENSVGIDGAGNPYLLFTTESSGIATPGAYDTSYAGGQDVAVFKTDAAGAPQWLTYLGGPQNESTETHELAVSATGNVYLAVPTQSSFSSIPNSSQTQRHVYGSGGGNNDTIVARLSLDGSQLERLTFFGGNDSDRAEGTGVDAAGNFYFTGVTRSTDFPVSSNALQPSSSGSPNAFMVKLSPDLERIYASYVGGSSSDFGRGAAVGPGGEFCLIGQSDSNDIATQAAAQPTRSGGWDGYVAVFAPLISADCIQDCSACDADGNGLINGVELAWIGRAFASCSADPSSEWWSAVDFDADGCVNGNDLAVLARPDIWGQSTAVCGQP